MKLYHYDNDGVFKKEGEARLDPLETQKAGKQVFLCPRNATFISPPIAQPGTAPVFEDGRWIIKIDKRGAPYWEPETGEYREVLKVGVDVPPQGVLVTPPKNMIKPKWNGLAWEDTYVPIPNPKLDKLKADMDKAKDLNELKAVLKEFWNVA